MVKVRVSIKIGSVVLHDCCIYNISYPFSEVQSLRHLEVNSANAILIRSKSVESVNKRIPA